MRTIRSRVRRCGRCGFTWKEQASRLIWDGLRVIGVALLPLGPPPRHGICGEYWMKRLVKVSGALVLEYYL